MGGCIVEILGVRKTKKFAKFNVVHTHMHCIHHFINDFLTVAKTIALLFIDGMACHTHIETPVCLCDWYVVQFGLFLRKRVREIVNLVLMHFIGKHELNSFD